jgi:ABC-2 type transport system ATP-binding protein
LAELRDSGTTVFLTTHYIEEAERLCDRIALIARGRLVRVDTLAGLIEDVQDAHVVAVTLSSGVDDRRRFLSDSLAGAELIWETSTELRVRSKVPVTLTTLVRLFESQGVEVLQARVLRPSLEDVFVKLTGIERPRWEDEGSRQGGAT